LATSPFRYPQPDIQVLPLEAAFKAAYNAPPGRLVDQWPPQQTKYLRVYLTEIGCKTAVIEKHYIDRVFMQDEAVFYVRNLRNYPNFTQRLHFFTEQFDQHTWKAMIVRAAKGEREAIEKHLQMCYRGFSVVRPLPDCPVGRTVLPAHATREAEGNRSVFGAVRTHTTHLAGFHLTVEGVQFQQQDQGVSACATTALWSALDSVAAMEEIPVSSPASITEAATRYPLQEGRPFPTEGLTLRQICEATRASGFSPLVIRGKKPEDDRSQIFSYAESGFSPVLALQSTTDGSPGHAVCAVGMRLGGTAPQTDPALRFREASTALLGLYIHDDRLGPYAFAQLFSHTDSRTGSIRTGVAIEWPDKTADQLWLLHAIVVPVPQKLRLSITRLRRVGLQAAQVIGQAFNEPQTTLNCRYDLGRRYVAKAYSFGLSEDGIYELACKTPLSRFVGLIEISIPTGPALDLVLDTTETNPEPAVLVCIKRHAMKGNDPLLRAIASYFGTRTIS
jgi:hypothetical protein